MLTPRENFLECIRKWKTRPLRKGIREPGPIRLDGPYTTIGWRKWLEAHVRQLGCQDHFFRVHRYVEVHLEAGSAHRDSGLFAGLCWTPILSITWGFVGFSMEEPARLLHRALVC